MHSTQEGINIRHQPIAQFHVIKDAGICRSAFRCDVPELPARPLAVGTEQRHEGSELMPTGLEFPPLFHIRRNPAGCLESPRGCGELVHHAESADIHSPERDSAHRVAQAGCHLGVHVKPAGADVAAPGGSGISLQAGESVPGQEEHSLVRIDSPLAGVNSFGIDESICIQVFSGRSQGRRGGEGLQVIHRQAIPEVRLAGIHPPGIDLASVFGI